MRVVRVAEFGGPEVLDVVEEPDPHAGPGEVRVRVTAAGLNPMDWMIAAQPETARLLGVTLPAGFGSDFAGVVDETGAGVEGVAAGDRVFGSALGRAMAGYLVLDPAGGRLLATPAGVSDVVASTLFVAGATADAALHVIGVGAGDTVLVGGAAGGVGTFAVQLARLAGASVVGTGSPGAFDYLRGLGAEPVAYGPGLAERVRALVPAGITAATALVGTETIEAALDLGVAPERISAIAAGSHPPGGARATGGADVTPGALDRIAAAIAAGTLTVPIAATFPLDRIRAAVLRQRDGHVHGKVVVTL